MSDQPDEFGAALPPADSTTNGSWTGNVTGHEGGVGVAEPGAEGAAVATDVVPDEIVVPADNGQIEASAGTAPIEATAETEPIEASSDIEPIEASAQTDPIEASADAEPIEAIAAVEVGDEPSASTDSSEVAAATADEPAKADDAPAAIGDDGAAFLAELARAMQATAGAERARVVEDIDRRRQAHIDQIQTRRESEATRMRTLADEDMKSIDSWADDERKRINDERERRATALREDLATSLAEHGSRIDREVADVETAIAAHRAEIDAFFAGFDHETDPVVIAQRASSRPTFPGLEPSPETVPAAAADTTNAAPPADTAPPAEPATPAAPVETASPNWIRGAFGPRIGATTEPDVIGVMDPEPAADPGVPWPAEAETSPQAAASDEPTVLAQAGESGETSEPVAVATAANGGHESMFSSTPVSRPLGWLRRDHSSGDRPNGDR